MNAATPGQAGLPPLPPKWTGKFRKRPVEVEAVQVIDDLRNHAEVAAWIEGNGGHAEIPFAEPCLFIETLEGTMRADIGWWVVRGVKGEFYPVRPDIFEASYEPAGAQAEPAPLPLGIALAALECIRQSHEPGTLAHDLARKALDDLDAARGVRQPEVPS